MSVLDKCVQRSEQSASRLVDNEAVVVTPEEGIVRVLNETAARIWELSDGTRTIRTIIGVISEEFAVDEEQAEKDIVELIDQLTRKKLVHLK